MKGFKKVTHCLFDMDGLLLDTESIYTKVYETIASKYGKTFDWNCKVQSMGLPGLTALAKIIEILDLPITPQEFYDMAEEMYKVEFPKAKLMPDTETIYKKAISAIANSHNKIYTDEVRFKVIGTPTRESARIAIEEMKLPLSVDQFVKQFMGFSVKFLNNVPLLKGAERLVKHLHHHKVPIAVATSSATETFNMKSANHKEFFSLFHHVVKGDDPELKRGKPHPDIFLLCASRFQEKPKPEACLVFEDAPNGIKAANAAGMQVVMVPDGRVDESLSREATIKLNSLEEFQPELFGLPPFNN